MIELSPERIAEGAGATIAAAGQGGRPERAVIDSREVGEGDLFFALQGERADGGEFATQALDAGAWGVVVDHARARLLTGDSSSGSGWVLAADDPLAALQRLATAWRRELGCRVVGITGSVGKTSAKDICRALLPMRVHRRHRRSITRQP